MFRPTRKILIAFATVISLGLITPTPPSAFAGGFGSGGISMAAAYGAYSLPSYAERPRVYVQPRPIVVEAPIRHRHRDPRNVVMAATRPIAPPPVAMPPAVTQPPPTSTTVTTNVTPGAEARDAELRKCLTMEYLPDGHNVVFRDTCAREQASTSTQPIAPNPPKVLHSSIIIEDATPH